MDLDLSGKAAVTTGGSIGIGRAVADGLVAESCDLATATGCQQLSPQPRAPDLMESNQAL